MVAPVRPVRCGAGPTGPPAPHGPRAATAAQPLRLFVTGDSMLESAGPMVVRKGGSKGRVDGCVDIRYSTGIVRPDYFDWAANARARMAERNPEAVVMMVGGNDCQNMAVDGRVLTAASPEWTAEYQRRTAAIMAVYANGGARRVYWVGMPIARSTKHTGCFRALDGALARAAAAQRGVSYVDIWALFAPDGRYTDTIDGRRVRNSDGIHLSVAGAELLAGRLLSLLDADWRISR